MSYEPYGSTTAPGDGGKADAAKSAASDTAHTAKEQASGVARTAKESGQHLAEEARHEARDVTREARQQAGSLLEQSREELTRQASEQQHKLAGGLRSFGSELDAMADGSAEHGEPGLATDLTRRLADGTDAAASWLDDREPGALLDEVKRFARNRPGTFLAIAAGAGLLAGRLTRGLKEAHADDDPSTGAAPTGAAPTGAAGGTGPIYGTQPSGTGATGPDAHGTTGGDPLGGVGRHSAWEGEQR